MTTEERITNALKSATDTKVFKMGNNILHLVPQTFKELFPGRTAIIVADKNTWRVAGEQVFELMQKSSIECGVFLFPESEFHADWDHIQTIDALLDQTGSVAISVGSGTINDLCKLTAHHHHQSYLSVATAASVDGYTSFGASITYEGLKQTFECPAPIALIADIDIIAKAPKEMTAAGYADLAAKIPAGAEWMIADLFGTEPIIPEAWHMLQDVLDEMLSDPEGVAAGKTEAIGALFEGLTLSGFAMQAARSSRPASCTDHLFSHFLDMTGHRFKGKLQSHGFQVAIGTLTMCAFFDEFLKLDLTKLDVDKCVEEWPSLESEQKRAKKLFRNFVNPKLGVAEITSKYSYKEGVREQLTKVRNEWPQLKKKYRQQVYTFEKMQRLFKIVGAPSDPSEIGVSRQKLREIVPYAQLMRARINLLDLAKRAEIYDYLVDKVFGPEGSWSTRAEK